MKEIMNSDAEVEYSEERNGDIKHSYFCINKVKDKLGWIPKYTLEEGLYKTIRYYQKLLAIESEDEVAISKSV